MSELCSFRNVLVTILLGMAFAYAGAEEPTAKPAADATRIATLIARLASEEFTEREAASDELARIGLPAFSALEGAALHPDREVRYRAIRVLSQIRELDLQRRLEAFLAGKDDQGEYPLPGWSRFAKAYGDTEKSRQLFVELQRADPEVMQSIEKGPREAADVVSQRTIQHQQALQAGQRQQMTLGQVTALVFVAAEADVPLPPNTMAMVLSYCMQPAMREVMIQSSKSEVPRKMLGSAIRNSDESAAPQAMNLAMEFNLADGLVPAEKILKADGARIPYMSQYALMTVARLGDASHLPLVEKLLDDKSVVTRRQENNKPVQELQVRDAALATAVLLTKQDLKAYFPGRPEIQSSDPRALYFNLNMLGFSSEEDRAVVFKKWAEYKAQQSKPDATRAEEANAQPPAEPK
jgi:hypothetical protein